MSAKLKEQAVVKRIKLGDLLPDAQNRRLRDWFVDDIAKKFDFGKWTPPVVRQNGVGYKILEGHHRVAAACKRGLGDLDVICYFHPDVDTDARVGEMYIGVNTTLTSTPTEKFLMRLRSEDAAAVAVNDLILACGYAGIADSPTDGYVHCPTACEWVYRGGMFRRKTGVTPAALVFALKTLKATYGDKRGFLRPDMVRGFGSFSHRYTTLTPVDVAKKVHAKHPEWRSLLDSTGVMKEAMACEGHKAMALVIRQDFNVGKRNGLEEW